MLVYVIDISAPDPIADYKTLLSELEMYKAGLSKKPSLIVANKADIEGSEAKYEALRDFCGCGIVPVSAMDGKNVKVALEMMREIVSAERESNNSD
jgi:GTPase